jgi:hypothetical protein
MGATSKAAADPPRLDGMDALIRAAPLGRHLESLLMASGKYESYQEQAASITDGPERAALACRLIPVGFKETVETVRSFGSPSFDVPKFRSAVENFRASEEHMRRSAIHPFRHQQTESDVRRAVREELSAAGNKRDIHTDPEPTEILFCKSARLKCPGSLGERLEKEPESPTPGAFKIGRRMRYDHLIEFITPEEADGILHLLTTNEARVVPPEKTDLVVARLGELAAEFEREDWHGRELSRTEAVERLRPAYPGLTKKSLDARIRRADPRGRRWDSVLLRAKLPNGSFPKDAVDHVYGLLGSEAEERKAEREEQARKVDARKAHPPRAGESPAEEREARKRMGLDV